MEFSFYRVRAVILRSFMAERRNFMRLMDAMYWPIMDILLWGMSSSWIAKSHSKLPDIVLVIMTGLVFWQVVMRASYEISVGLIEEVWSKSFVTLFSTPLTVREWILGVMLNGIIKTLFVLFFGVLIVWLLYALNIFTFGWMLIPFVISLILFGWVTGFVGASLIVYWGNKVSSVPWVFAFLFAPFSAVYYPIDALPVWGQYLAYCLPLSYIFEGMRTVIFSNTYPWEQLAISFGLNSIYLFISLSFFKFMFKKSRKRGFDRL